MSVICSNFVTNKEKTGAQGFPLHRKQTKNNSNGKEITI